jgi:hypothetical protein
MVEWKRTDQAARRERFEEANPGVKITRRARDWLGVIAIDGSEKRVRHYELGGVLDALEVLVSSREDKGLG